MANETAEPNKPTVVYSPLRLNWKNVIAGSVIGLLIVAIGVFAFSYYNPNATPVYPVEIKKASPSAKVATSSAQKDETADWKTYEDKSAGYSIKYPRTLPTCPDGNFGDTEAVFCVYLFGPTQGDGQEFHDGLSTTIKLDSKAKNLTSEDYSLEKKKEYQDLYPDAPKPSVGTTTIDNKSVSLLNSSIVGGATERSVYIPLLGKGMLTIRGVYGGDKEKEYLDSFTQILSTFKFSD